MIEDARLGVKSKVYCKGQKKIPMWEGLRKAETIV
jgi:hypothetical protein